MTGKDRKPWRCPNGHILGEAVRFKVNGGWVTRLALYRQAVEEGVGEVVALVEGGAYQVRCSICGDMRTWAMGEDVIRRVLRIYANSGLTRVKERV